MDPRYDSQFLFRSLLNLISILFIAAILGLAYFPLEGSIKEYLNRPDYSSTQLEKISKARGLARGKERADDWNLIEKGIHVKTGLKDDQDLQLVIGACTSCHSAKLITQNRASRVGWKNMILWMQETQGLVDLGSSESKILDYLATHYAPETLGRRENLDMEKVEWYVLSLED